MIENNWNVVVITLCSVLLIVLLWAEVKRNIKAWLALRIAATIIAIAALALMVMPLYVKQKQAGNVGIPIVLLTHAYQKDSVALFKKTDPNSAVYFYNTGDEKSGFYGAVTIDHVSQLKRQNAGAIHLFGEGLEPEELNLLNGLPIVFHSTIHSPGLQAISWNRQLVSGEKLKVQGTWFNATTSPQKIVLTGFNSSQDSVTIPPNTTKAFQLSAIPKNTGKAIFSLVALRAKETVVNEPLPIEVITPQPISVLVLASSPDFENKFLKNWLADHAYKVAIRTAISRNKYSKEFVNLSALPVASLQASIINKFDVVIADAKELKMMSRVERVALQSSIDQQGLGLIIKADSSLPQNAFYNRNFDLISIQGPESKSLLIHAADTGIRFKPLQADGILYLRSTTGNPPLYYDQQNRPLVSEAIFGSGKILIQPVANTYQWVLSGNKEDYEKFWSGLLNTAAKKQQNTEHWCQGQALPIVDKPVNIQLLHSNDSLPFAQIGLEKVYMQQSTLLPYKWNGTYWPAKPGWHSFVKTNGTFDNWFVFSKENFKTIQSISKTNTTKHYLLAKTFQPKNQIAVPVSKSAIPSIYFFIIFLLASVFLWVEKKFL